MNCPRCGEQLPKDTAFCRRCGAALAEPDKLPEHAHTAAESVPESEGRVSGAAIAVASAAAVCIVGAALFFGLRGADREDSAPDSRPNTVRRHEEKPAPAEEAPDSSSAEPPDTTSPTATTPPAATTPPSDTPDNNGEPFVRSANIVNGGQLDYDGESWFTGGSGLRRTDRDGTRTQLCQGTIYYINAEDGSLYFTKDGLPCSMNTDGSELSVLLQYPAHELTYYGGRLYFCSQLGGNDYYICSMLPDGSDLKKLTQCLEWYMNIGGDTIYFTDYPGGRHIMAMDLDGSNLREICTDECYDLCLVGSRLYYSRGEVRTLCVLDLSTSAITELGGHAQYTNYYLGRLYYVDGFGNIASRYPDGTGTRTEFAGKGFSYLTFAPGKLCYCDSRNNNALEELELVQQVP